MMNEQMNKVMAMNEMFSGFSCKAQFDIGTKITDAQSEKIEKLNAMKWRATKVYFSNNGRSFAIVLKQVGAVGILYPNGAFVRPGNSKSITLDRDLLNRSI